jgi:hypothetical protein
MKLFGSKKNPKLKDKMNLKIICPLCNKTTKYHVLSQLPINEEIKRHIEHNGNLQTPNQMLSKALYRDFLKIVGPDQTYLISPDLCYIEKHEENCSISGKESVLLNYYTMNHKEKTAGATFRIVSTYKDNSFIID